MTVGIIVVCLMALTAEMGSALPNAMMSPVALGRQELKDFTNSQLNNGDEGDSIHMPLSFYLPSDNLDLDLLDSTDEDWQRVAERAGAGPASLLRRSRRQVDRAMDLSLSHNDRPVGRLHGSADLHASGNNGRNYHASGGAGLGAVVFRSNNGRHSLGVGAAVNQHRGRFQGHRYRSRPSYGVGLGYRFKF